MQDVARFEIAAFRFDSCSMTRPMMVSWWPSISSPKTLDQVLHDVQALLPHRLGLRVVALDAPNQLRGEFVGDGVAHVGRDAGHGGLQPDRVDVL